LAISGSSSGVISVLPQAVAGTYNFNLPATAGTAGQVLTSGGGGSSVMTWTTTTTGTVTSVGLTVPSFLSVAGSPVTSSGTLAVSLSGTALPVLNGGTGVTTSTGSGSNVLSTSPTLVTPVLGNAGASSLAISGSSSGVVSILPQAIAGTYNFNLPITAGTSGQVLTSGGGGSGVMTWTTTTTGTVTSVGLTVPSFLSVAGSPVTSSGTLAVSLSGTALPVLNGGTGVTTSTGSGSVVLSSSPTLVTPILGVASATALTLTIPLAIAQGGTGTTTSTGSGSVVFANSPSLVTPALGAATASGLTITGTGTAFATNISTASSTSIATFYASTLGTNAYTQINVGLSGGIDVNWGYNNSPVPYGYVSLNNGSSMAKFFASGTASSSTTTGALVVTGGLGVSGALYANNAVFSSALPVLSGGTGVTTSTGSGSVVLSTSPSLVTPVLGAASASSLAITAASGSTPFNVNITGTSGTEAGSFFQPSLAVNGFVQVNMGISSILDFNLGYVNASTPYGFMALNDGIISTQIFTPTSSTSVTTGTMVITNGLGVSGNVSTSGLNLQGSSSGVVSILPQAAAGTWNFNLPTTAGTSGYVLTSGGGGASPMTWSSTTGFGSVSSVGLTVPSFLSVSGSPVTTSGTLALAYSGTALPVLNGGTGTTTSTGSGSVVLSAGPTITGTNTALGLTNTANDQTILTMYNSGLGSTHYVQWAIGISGAANVNMGYNNSATPFGYIGLNGGGGGSKFYAQNTVSSSTTTGTLTVTGGLGVSAALYANNAVFSSASNQTLAVAITGTTSTYAITTFQASLASGNYVETEIGISNTVCTNIGYNNSATPYGYLGLGGGGVSLQVFPRNTVSTSGTTGAIVVQGGLGVTGSINTGIGGTASVRPMQLFAPSISFGNYVEQQVGMSVPQSVTLGYSNTSPDYGYLSIDGATSSTSTLQIYPKNTSSTNSSTGAIVVQGGLGVTGTLNAGTLALANVAFSPSISTLTGTCAYTVTTNTYSSYTLIGKQCTYAFELTFSYGSNSGTTFSVALPFPLAVGFSVNTNPDYYNIAGVSWNTTYLWGDTNAPNVVSLVTRNSSSYGYIPPNGSGQSGQKIAATITYLTT
jgi:hypothetical protein